MAHIHGSVVIDRPVETVFAYALDQRHEPSYNPAMRECVQQTAGPIGVGTVFASVMDTRGGTLRMTSELTAVEAPHLLGSRTTMAGSQIDGTLGFAAEGDSGRTRMTWDWDVRTQGWTRLAAPLVWLLGHRMERRIWTGLKARVEAT
ncbi:SRPBCC family protein [Actinotalea sp.]|uniref:SRPBCC family protein n=1 Tax=Actinotalea sp. TaxID=1872145 RepID=UPI002C395548|nr:SRPBCC family protein [Actinotalea sp.]HQY33889.1 SRPBCC family protein [Actinotalea sp.]HRA49695.1 SRPBCC family protein [Actinotalea sp.]